MRNDGYEHIEELNIYFKDIKKYRPLSREAERELAQRITMGDKEALTQLVNANLRFVVSVAKGFRYTGIPFTDLIAEGNMGLIKAAQKFDSTKNTKFISYAVWWIKAYIQSYISHNRTEVDDVVDQINGGMLMSLEVEEENINERFEGEMELLNMRNAAIEDLMSCLHGREKEILTLYFGIEDGKEKTLEEIGEKMSLTKERVRQLKDKAMVKLRVQALFSEDFQGYREMALT